jgi:hypothetical protein
MWAQ